MGTTYFGVTAEQARKHAKKVCSVCGGSERNKWGAGTISIPSFDQDNVARAPCPECFADMPEVFVRAGEEQGGPHISPAGRPFTF